MRRIVSVWLPYWRTERRERVQALTKPLENQAQKPLAIIEGGKGGRRLAAVNQAAAAAGLAAGMLLTDACAILPSLKTGEAAPAEEAKDLKRLAAWCRRYTPWTAPGGSDGIVLDVTGACHLLGGEQPLLGDLIQKLAGLELTARSAMAGTLGAAWALARFGVSNGMIVPEGEEARFIAPLPVKGLRLDESGCALLKRLGLGTIGQLFDLPREALRARLGRATLLRLFREKFTRLEGRFDESLAFDAASLYAARTERLSGQQAALDGGASNSVQEEGMASLLDRLTARLGAEAVTRFDFKESHIPERAVTSVPVSDKTSSHPPRRRQRPLLLLPHAEPVTVLAEVPDYPPHRFTWRRITFRVARAEGPERLSPEWWPDQQGNYNTRDYYRIEDETGRRFWLYRDGLYRQGGAPHWYLHGLFP